MEAPEFLGCGVQATVNGEFPNLPDADKEKLVSLLRSNGIINSYSLWEWNSKSLLKLGVRPEWCAVLASKGYIPKRTKKDTLLIGTQCYEMSEWEPSHELRNLFDKVNTGGSVSEVKLVKTWARMDRCPIKDDPLAEEQRLYNVFRGLVSAIADSNSPVKYDYEEQRPGHYFPFNRHAVLSFYLKGEPKTPGKVIWRMVLAGKNSNDAFMEALGGLVYAVRDLFNSQPDRGFAIGAVYGRHNVLVLCKFVQTETLPVQVSEELTASFRGTREAGDALKTLPQMLCSNPDVFGYNF